MADPHESEEAREEFEQQASVGILEAVDGLGIALIAPRVGAGRALRPRAEGVLIDGGARQAGTAILAGLRAGWTQSPAGLAHGVHRFPGPYPTAINHSQRRTASPL